jgi:diguanylate cyclase (GGDEF)-like protein
MNDAKSQRKPAGDPPTAVHELLYTPAEERFERITRLAQHALCVPVAGVMLLNEGKQWFKTLAGWDAMELSEERALCSFAFEADGPTVIADMEKDARTAGHPFVTGSPSFKSCALYPLFDRNQWPVGGFCIFDVKPRVLTASERQSVLDLAELAQRELRPERGGVDDVSLAATLSAARREGTIDPLTRVWNRRGAYLLLRNAIARADQHDQTVATIGIDIDGFKHINQRFGHQVGDEVLRKVATRLVNAVRSHDLVFRLVDDQFLIVLPNLERTLAENVLERVRWAICANGVRTRSALLPISVTTSLDVRSPADDVGVDGLLRRMDLLLQQAKSNGGDHLLAS